MSDGQERDAAVIARYREALVWIMREESGETVSLKTANRSREIFDGRHRDFTDAALRTIDALTAERDAACSELAAVRAHRDATQNVLSSVADALDALREACAGVPDMLDDAAKDYSPRFRAKADAIRAALGEDVQP